MADYHGSCLCSRVKFELCGELESFYLCHCEYCQKDTGSAHSANLFTQSATLKWVSGADNVSVYHLPHTRHVKSFCQHCGSALPTILDNNIVAIPAGCLDTVISIAPTAHIFNSSRASWEQNLVNIPTFEKLPTS